MLPFISSTLKPSIIFSFGLVIMALHPANGQQTLEVDLAEPGERVESISDGKYFIEVQNMIPSDYSEYEISIFLKNISIPSIDLSPPMIPSSFASDGTRCDKIPQWQKQLDSASSEEEVSNIVSLLQMYKVCDETTVQEIVSTTIFKSPMTYDLQKGQFIEVIVEKEDKKWVRRFSTGARGEWRTHFGISAITDWANQRYDYYSYEKDGTYMIGRQRSRNLIMVPSVFFTWMPVDMELKDLSAGLTGGFGTNFDSSSAFAGINITYNHNLTFVLGVATHQQQTASPEYFNMFERELSSPTPISSEDLMIEQIVMNPFISLLIRFSQNPFASVND